MHYSRPRTSAIAGAWLFCFLAPSAPKALMARECESESSGVANIALTISPDATGVRASYQLDNDVSCLQLTASGPEKRQSWKVTSANVVLSPDGNNIRFTAGRENHFEVDIGVGASDYQYDRNYTSLIRFGDGRAVAIYSEYLLPVRAAWRSQIRFSDGSAYKSTKRVVFSSDSPAYIVLGTPVAISHDGVRIVIDQALPQWVRAAMLSETKRAAAILRRIGPATSERTFILNYSGGELSQNSSTYYGSVSGNQVRMALYGKAWATPSTDALEQVQVLTLHEMFHTVNSDVQPGVQGDGLTSLLEGGAEAAAHVLQRQLAMITANDFADVEDQALIKCLALDGNTLSQKEMADFRAAPYVCGQALQYFAIAVDDRHDYLGIWRRLLASASGHPYGWAEWLSSIRATSDRQKEALNALNDLVHSRTTLEVGMQRLERDGIVQPLSQGETKSQSISAAMASRAMWYLLDQNCTGRRGFTTLQGILILDAAPESCQSMKDGFHVVAIDGIKLDTGGLQAYASLMSQCGANGLIDLTNESGDAIEVNCIASPPPPPMFYRLSEQSRASRSSSPRVEN